MAAYGCENATKRAYFLIQSIKWYPCLGFGSKKKLGCLDASSTVKVCVCINVLSSIADVPRNQV